jgi:translation elongation factor EF-Tu-like GTPase
MPIDDVYTLELKRPYRKTKVSSFPEKECSKKTGVPLVSGTVERGIIKLYEEVEIIGTQPTRKTTITGIEMFNKLLDDARAGETIFARLDGISKYDVKRGQILIKPGSVSSYEG